MKKLLLFLLALCSSLGPLHAEGHPMAAQIQAYREEHPLELRVLELLIYVSQKSEELNAAGQDAFARGRYQDSIDLFQDAVLADEDNSIAWYNLSRAYALAGDYGEAIRCLREAVVREWFFGLDLMVNPDLDRIRRTDLESPIDEQDPWGDVAFRHAFSDRGAVTLLAIGYGGSAREIGSGYYSVINGQVFEFFPDLDEYSVEGPNGPITVPASTNRVWVPDIPWR